MGTRIRLKWEGDLVRYRVELYSNGEMIARQDTTELEAVFYPVFVRTGDILQAVIAHPDGEPVDVQRLVMPQHVGLNVPASPSTLDVQILTN